MITIEYCPQGQAISDFDCSDWLYNLKHNLQTPQTIQVSTGLPIHMVRLAICRGEIPHTSIVFLYYGQVFQSDEYGAISDWPRGFADRDIAIAEDILRAASKRSRQTSSQA